jgi:hypothetical protein
MRQAITGIASKVAIIKFDEGLPEVVELTDGVDVLLPIIELFAKAKG